jgi:hypothetical protein
VPNSVSFGAVTQGTAQVGQTISLTSSGTGPLHIVSVALGGVNSSDFSLTNNCAAAAYAVGATCSISASLSPLAIGVRSAFITISDDAPNSPQVIGLNATVNPAIAISPAAPGSNAITLVAGQTADFRLLLTPGAGFSGSASFVCAGAPTAAMCTAPTVPISGGPVSYVVSVSTTKSTMIVAPPNAPQLPPSIWLHLFSIAACCGIVVLFLQASKLRGLRPSTPLLPLAALALLVSVCIVEATGCGGGASAVSPQGIPTPHVLGTPQGTSVITVTPSVTTSTGTALPAFAPIQLTLTVQ